MRIFLIYMILAISIYFWIEDYKEYPVGECTKQLKYCNVAEVTNEKLPKLLEAERLQKRKSGN